MPQDLLDVSPSGIAVLPPREPLSPLWHTFITRAWQPRQREVVLLYAQGKLTTLSPNRLAISFNGLTLDPFEFSNRRVAKHRAAKFLESLKPLRRGEGEAVGRVWWPEDVDGVIEAIKEERRMEVLEAEEEMERLAGETRPCDPEVWLKVVMWLSEVEEARKGERRPARRNEAGPAAVWEVRAATASRSGQGLPQSLGRGAFNSVSWPTPASTTGSTGKRRCCEG